MTEDLALVKLDAARMALAQARDVYDLIDIRDQAAVVQAWIHRRDLSLDDENRAAELRVRAEREIGRRLKETVRAGNPQLSSDTTIETRLPQGVSRDQSSQYQRMAAVPDDRFEGYLARASDAGERITTRAVVGLGGSGPHVSRNTGAQEWYTPPEYIEAARNVMGDIDCDPASSEVANRIVKAKAFYTREQDGLDKPWGARVWMNPPYAQPLVSQFCLSLVERLRQGEVKEALVLVNNATETDFFQTMLEVATAVCFPRGRIRFLDAEGNASGAPLQGQAVLYFGKNDSFSDTFGRFGQVLST